VNQTDDYLCRFTKTGEFISKRLKEEETYGNNLFIQNANQNEKTKIKQTIKIVKK
jgi:hypothetical protein